MTSCGRRGVACALSRTATEAESYYHGGRHRVAGRDRAQGSDRSLPRAGPGQPPAA
ncbi:MAG: hypothetical protein MZV70_41765 [Desulfobacterales bacterium]|nr:hypothetical protein [Desulfobacterales bacterium]